MGEDSLWHGHPDPAPRLLRPARAKKLPACQRLPDLSRLPDGPEFLPELRQQRQRTLTLIDVCTSKRQARVVEMNQQVLTNLDRMIGEAEKDEQKDAANAG